MLIRHAVLSLFAVLCALPVMAHAQQATLPGFEISNTGAAPSLESQDYGRSPNVIFNGIKNEEMRSILQLQNQIMMIQALTNWQSQITKLEETYQKAGLPFSAPNPPRAICEQVPPNSVCGAAYADLGTGAPLLPMPQNNMPKPEPVKAEAEPEPKKPVAEAEPEEPEAPRYRWADIRCMANACSAVLINEDNGVRVSAVEGETLDDNVLVQQISPLGVTLRANGVAVELLPSDAPAQKFAKETAAPAVSASPGSDGLNDALKNVPSGAGDSPAPVPGAPATDASGELILLDDGEGNGTDSPITAPTTTTTTTTTTTSAPPAADNTAGGGGLGPTGLF